MQNNRLRKIFQIIMIVGVIIIIVQLGIMGVTYLQRQGSIVYSESVNQSVDALEGYITVGSSDFKNSDNYSYVEGLQKAVIKKYDYDQNLLWEKQYESEYNSTFNGVVAHNNYYYAVGSIESNAVQNADGLTDAIIVKYDRFGEVVEEQVFQVLGDSKFMKLEVHDDFIYVVGQSILPPMDIGVASTGGGVLIKYSTNLNEVWRANFGGAKSGVFNDLEVTGDAIYVVGKDAANTGLIVKYDMNGNRVFVKNYEFTDSLGFSSVLIENNNMFVAGSKGYDNDEDKIETEALFLTYDLDGNLVDGKTYNPSLRSRYNVIKKVGNEIWAVGHTETLNLDESTDELNVFDKDAVISKYSLSGEELSTKTIVGNQDDYFTDILTINSVNYLVSYSSSSDLEFKSNQKDFIPNLIME